MTTKAVKPAPPPAPPAPVVGTSAPNVGAPTKASPKEQLLARASRLRAIAGKISTPNVVDTQAHAAELIQIAGELETIAKEM